MRRSRHGIVLGRMAGSVAASLWLAGTVSSGAAADRADNPAQTDFVQAIRGHGTLLGTLAAHVHVCDPVHPVGGLARSDWEAFLERIAGGPDGVSAGLEAFDDAVKATAVAPCGEPSTVQVRTRVLARSGLETLGRLKRLAWVAAALRQRGKDT
jgi:hypothetical protein